MTAYQKEFSAALLDASHPAPDGVINPDGKAATKRFDVYRNNVVHSLVTAMTEAFPAVEKIVGETFFKNMCAVFVRAHPPTTPMLMFYGAEFPEFLENFEPIAHLKYLPDLARLEQSLRQSYHASDAEILPADALAQLDEAALMGTKFIFRPSTILLGSNHPIHGIWQYNIVSSDLKITNPRENILITRPEFDPVMRVVTDAEYLFIQSLMDGDELASAIDKASQSGAFDLAGAFQAVLETAALHKLV